MNKLPGDMIKLILERTPHVIVVQVAGSDILHQVVELYGAYHPGRLLLRSDRADEIKKYLPTGAFLLLWDNMDPGELEDIVHYLSGRRDWMIVGTTTHGISQFEKISLAVPLQVFHLE